MIIIYRTRKSTVLTFIHFYRALSFILVFLSEVLAGEEDLVKCAKKAYEQSLKQYHGWMVQGIFSVCIKLLNLCSL